MNRLTMVQHYKKHHASKPLERRECGGCESRGLSVFCQLEQAALQQFDQYKVTNRYKKGQVIFYEDNHPLGLYCLFEGRIKLYKNGIDGRPQILRLAGPGDLLGYRALFAGEPYQATAQALEDTVLCFIDKNIFFGVLAQQPELARNIIQKLAGELGVAENLVTSLAQRSARERMAELLLILSETYGEGDPTVKKINLSLSRAEMAEMIGITVETAIRLLSEFKKKGWIQVAEREICILKSDALVEIANFNL